MHAFRSPSWVRLLWPPLIVERQTKQDCFVLAAGHVRSKKKKKKNSYPKRTARRHQNHSSTATAANSRRIAAKQAPSVSPSSPASMDRSRVRGIGRVQLSRSTTQKHDRQYEYTPHGQTDKRTDRLIKQSGACTPPAMKRLFSPIQAKNGLV